jgi:hypothetical protein
MKSTCDFASWALERCAGGQVISLTRPSILDPYHHVQPIRRHQEHQPCSSQVCPVVIVHNRWPDFDVNVNPTKVILLTARARAVPVQQRIPVRLSPRECREVIIVHRKCRNKRIGDCVDLSLLSFPTSRTYKPITTLRANFSQIIAASNPRAKTTLRWEELVLEAELKLGKCLDVLTFLKNAF